MSRTTVGDVVVDGLGRAGVTRVFTVASAESALLRAFGRHGIDRIAAAGAASACVMAAATAELTNTPGVALVPTGAGAVAGIMRASDDRSPVVLLTEGAASISGLVHAVKASLAAEPPSAAHWIAHAVQLAMKHPRGPVHVDVATDAAAVPVATAVVPPPLPPPDPHALDGAVRLLAAAARPVVVVGAQCRWEEDATWLRPFAETLPAPALVTVKAKGVLPDPHPLVLGLLGLDTSAAVLAKADLVVTVGVEPVELGEWTPPAAVLHLGPCAPEGPLGSAAGHVIGDIGLILGELAPRLRAARRADWDVAELDRLKRSGALRAASVTLTASRVARIAREMTAAGTIAAVDGGEGMLDLAAAWQATAPREFLAPNRLAAAGVALPAAIAAQLARPDRAVLAFTGGAGFEASRAELATVARLELPVVLLVLAAAPPAPTLDTSGALRSATCDGEGALRPALAAALAARRPAVLGVRVHAETSTV